MRSRADERSWSFAPGEEIVASVRAWELLGDGRRCETWLAWCERRFAPVTIKLPRPGLADERTRRALAREADNVRCLVHPGIQRLLAADLDAERPHLLFEYVEGPTLDSLLDDQGPLAPHAAARLGIQLASILHYVHGRAVVHCDVKPGNLVLRDGRALLIDFDVARRIGEGGEGTRARGTADYMAPEQIGGAGAQPGMDLFALGATLYEAVTDAPAFEGSDETGGVPYEQLERRPPAARTLDPAIPEPLDRAISALLEPDPSRRPQSALAALGLLSEALPPGEAMWPRWVTPLLAGPPSAARTCAG